MARLSWLGWLVSGKKMLVELSTIPLYVQKLHSCEQQNYQ